MQGRPQLRRQVLALLRAKGRRHHRRVMRRDWGYQRIPEAARCVMTRAFWLCCAESTSLSVSLSPSPPPYTPLTRKLLERDKIDVDKFGSPTSYQMLPSILRMRCAKMCARGPGCRRGGFSARCMQCECAT